MITQIAVILVLLGKLNAQVFTLPGTKWCGDGNNAATYDDLGEEVEADKCCRDHQNCDYMKAGESKYGLTNPGPFTALACECDENFRTCLRNANTLTADLMYTIYFIVLRKWCYKQAYICTEYNPITFECVKQEFKYGWFPVSPF